LPEVEITATHRYEPVLSRSDAARVVDLALERFLGPQPPEAVVFVRDPLLTESLAVEFAARVGTALASRGIHALVTVEVAEAPAPPPAPPVAKPFGPDDTADLDEELELFLAEADKTTGIESPVPRTKPRTEPRAGEGRPAPGPARPAPVRRTRSIDRVRKPKTS
jgi:hypothetical protein